MRVSATVHAEPDEVPRPPVYRVNFWREPTTPAHAWILDAYVVMDAANVVEVMEWAASHADGRAYEVFAEVDEQGASSFGEARTARLLRLFGSDPTEAASSNAGRVVKK